ncbi:hypothetical protein [Clostridium lundense]|uniref:hypothetical protein n=1 Tax=Clostridium lundense TaxID=319475 RepID=UPI000483CC8E|nr:hypothetical protein [Clostridium lundense]
MKNKLNRCNYGWSEKIIEVKPCESCKKVDMHIKLAPPISCCKPCIDIDEILILIALFIILNKCYSRKCCLMNCFY